MLINIFGAIRNFVCQASKKIMSALKKIANKPHVIGLVLSAVLCIAVAIHANAYTSVVEVYCNGNNIGYLPTADKVAELENSVRSVVDDAGDTLDFSFRETIAKKNKLKDCDSMVNSVLNNTDMVVERMGLYIDNELVAFVPNKEEGQSIIDELSKKYLTEGMVFDGFSSEYSISSVYVSAEKELKSIASLDDLLALGVKLDVLTHKVNEYDEKIAYTTKYSYDDTKYTDYKVTTQKGENGLKHVVTNESYVNGEKVNSEIVEEKVVKEPVQQKITKGSKKKPASPETNKKFSAIKARLDALNAANTGDKVTFIFPLEIRSAGYISSYWGDGRNHKGMDFATPKGTNIYAVADGKVTISQDSSSYGYYIEIEHKNGIKTRYAHASKLLVEVGQTVKQGDHIAEVGSTGRSTGNHLHFEVWKNGTRVNPAPYLAIE